jgi:two-component system response regulator RegX3
MGTIFSSDDPAAIGALAKAIAREVVHELTASKELHILVDTPAAGAVLQVGPIAVDIDRHEATVRGRVMELKKREFELLVSFMRNAGKVLTREQLLELVWRDAALDLEDNRTIDVHVRRLRAHLEDESGWLSTVTGVGYKLNDR